MQIYKSCKSLRIQAFKSSHFKGVEGFISEFFKKMFFEITVRPKGQHIGPKFLLGFNAPDR